MHAGRHRREARLLSSRELVVRGSQLRRQRGRAALPGVGARFGVRHSPQVRLRQTGRLRCCGLGGWRRCAQPAYLAGGIRKARF